MRRLLTDIFLAAAICVILLFSLKFFAKYTGLFLPLGTKDIYQILQSLIVLFFIIGLTYKRLWDTSLFKNILKSSAFFLCQLLLIVFIYNFLSMNKNILEYYKYFTNENFISWQGRMYAKDSSLGYRMIKNNRSALVYNYLPAIPVRTDANGFRIPDSAASLTDINKKTDLLFLGCSFTFGSACKAEESFPFLVAEDKKMNYINAAVGGYGLAQMYLQAKQLIPKLKPRYIIVQNSPWLIIRAISEFAPSRGGYLIPTPYFADHGKGFQIEMPIYNSSVEQLFPAKDREKYAGRFLKYYFEKGLIYFGLEQYHVLVNRCKNFLFLKKMPTKREKEAEQFTYTEIFRLAEQYKAKVILLNLGNGTGTVKEWVPGTPDICVANADSVLYKYIGTSSKEKYAAFYGHWRKKGNDSVFVDSHPNKLSHQLIARTILMQIKNEEKMLKAGSTTF